MKNKNHYLMGYTFMILLVFQFLLINCSMDDYRQVLGVTNEIKRITSPDKKVDAVIVSIDESLSATGYYVFIDIVGFNAKQMDLKYSQFTCDNQDSLDIIWINERLLNIKFKQARIFNFSNFWHSEDIGNWEYVVEIKLNSNDSSSYLSKRVKYEE